MQVVWLTMYLPGVQSMVRFHMQAHPIPRGRKNIGAQCYLERATGRSGGQPPYLVRTRSAANKLRSCPFLGKRQVSGACDAVLSIAAISGRSRGARKVVILHKRASWLCTSSLPQCLRPPAWWTAQFESGGGALLSSPLFPFFPLPSLSRSALFAGRHF